MAKAIKTFIDYTQERNLIKVIYAKCLLLGLDILTDILKHIQENSLLKLFSMSKMIIIKYGRYALGSAGSLAAPDCLLYDCGNHPKHELERLR